MPIRKPPEIRMVVTEQDGVVRGRVLIEAGALLEPKEASELAKRLIACAAQAARINLTRPKAGAA